VNTSSVPLAPATGEQRTTLLFQLCIGVYFLGGFLNSLVGLLVPRLRMIEGLNHTSSLLVQFAFHSSYLLFAVPITVLVVKFGYMRSIAVGLVVIALGCGLLAASLRSPGYMTVLLALLAVAGGVTFLQIAANIVVPVVEPARRAVSRLTLLQGFNSLGTVLASLAGSALLLGTGRQPSGGLADHIRVVLPFLAVALVALVLAAAFICRRDLLRASSTPRRVPLSGIVGVMSNRRLLAGGGAMFAYVGAEVTIGTLLVEYLAMPDILDLPPVAAGQLVGLYWTGALVGRLVGARYLTRYGAPTMLLGCAVAAVALVAMAIGLQGPVAAAALLAVGLCNAIMYPTIFALSLPDDHSTATYASMLLCMVVVGGAIIPLLTGVVADVVGLTMSFILPGACYIIIAAFAWCRHRTWDL
jgi:FHS family L-fucose permease-like MFS transporter